MLSTETKAERASDFTARGTMTVGEVLAGLVLHPYENLLRNWNWKSAILSACIRGTIFFATNISAGFEAALSAMVTESAFYIFIAGFHGALIQAFRRSQPVWAATLTVMALLPAINHSLEFALHWLAGTENLATSIAASVCFSALSAAFNLFAMRRGILIVGEGRQSLVDDLRRMPRIVFEFFTVTPRLLLTILNMRRENTKQTKINETNEKADN